MPTYEVKSVGAEPREWSSTHGGSFLSYKVDLAEDGGAVAMGIEWTKKPESQPPSVGERVVGHLEPGKFSEKFKIDYEATKELGGGASREAQTGTAGSRNGGGKRDWKPESERDPERSARILRQHSQEMALRAACSAGYFQGEITTEKLRDDLIPLVDFFDQDVNKAGQAAKQAQGSAPPAQEGAAPLPSASPGPVSQPADDTHQYFCKLLEDAALNPDAASALATFIVEKFDNDQRRRAETGLKHLDTQKETLDKARYSYEKATGQLLPDPADDESIPF
jgi:hypothetical protein